MANDDLAKLDQLTTKEEKIDKDDDSIDISKENYLNNKSLREFPGKNDAALKLHFLQKWPFNESQMWIVGYYDNTIT